MHTTEKAATLKVSTIVELSTEELANEEMSTVSGGGIYLKYGDIKGDTTSAGHEKWIEVNSY